MATIGFRQITGPFQVEHLPEHTTANSFVAGDIVYLNSGKLALVTSDAAVFGVAGAPASGTADTSLPVYVITPTQLWVAEVDTTSAVSQVGGKYGLNIGTAGSMNVDIGDTSTTSVRIERLDSRDVAGTATGRVVVKFDQAALQNF